MSTRVEPDRKQSFRPGVLPVVVLVLSVIGALVSTYLVYEHFTAATTFACPASGAVDCVKVTTSQYADLLGIPVAVLGLLFFLGMVVLSWPTRWRLRPWRQVRLVAALVGVVFVLYLVWAELFRINAICLWCTGVHVITLAIFVLLAFDEALSPVSPASRTPGP